PWIPSAVPLFIGLVLAMAMDALAYTAFAGEFGEVPEMFWPQKVQAGAAAGLPVSIYLDLMLRRNREHISGGIVNRGSFDILDLRRQLERQREQLVQIKDTFSRYVSAEVVDTIVRDPSRVRLGGEKR